MERAYKKPDLHAPRNRDRVKDFLAYPEKDPYGFFARMKSQHPELAKYNNRAIGKFIEEYNSSLVTEAINNSWGGVALPENLGTIIVSACSVPAEIAKRNIDFNASNRLGIAVPYNNMHSDRYVAKINYVNNIRWHRFKNHELWKFKPCRNFQRSVAAAFKDGKHNWFKQFTKRFRLSDIFAAAPLLSLSVGELNAEKNKKLLLEAHDEFRFD